MRLPSIVSQLGLVNSALYVAGRLLERFTGQRARIVKYVLFAQPVGRPGTQRMRPDAATSLRGVPEGDALIASFPRPAPILAARYAAGASCTAALVRGEFAGFIWLQRDRYEEDEVRCTYVLEDPAHSVWDFDVYVEPRYRLGRTMARLWGHVDGELAAQGVCWSFSRISAFNPASLASHARLGIVPCGSALFLVLGPWQLSWLPGFPFVHLSLSPRQVPMVRLRPPAPATLRGGAGP